MDKLNPCPFCGGEARRYNGTTDCYGVTCKKCSCKIFGYASAGAATRAWNRRKIDGLLEDAQQWLDERPTVDAVEVVHGYNEGDVCFYGFHDENKSLALVEIVKILNDERGVAEVRFLKVFVDDTGNGMFDYLLRSGNRMNVSIKYLRNITPNFGAKMDGGTGR